MAREAERAGQGDTIKLVAQPLHREAVGADAIVINEYSFRPDYCPRKSPARFRRLLRRRARLGLSGRARRQARRAGRLVVAMLGDGAYMFANPTACH